MINFTIDKNVPFPKRRVVRPSQYPFLQMAIGDSFVFSEKERTKVQSSAAWATKKIGWRFSTRRVDDRTYRCWRLK